MKSKSKMRFVLKRMFNVLILVLVLGQYANAGIAFFATMPEQELRSKVDSVSVVLSHEPIEEYQQLQVLLIRPDVEGVYPLRFTNLDKICKIYLRIHCGDKTFQPYYYAEPGDSVQLHINEDTDEPKLSFTGRQAEKYNIMTAISENREKWLSDSVGFGRDPYRSGQLINEFISQARKQISEQESKISSISADLLITEATSFYYTQWATNISYFYKKQDSLSQKELMNLYLAFPPAHYYQSDISGYSLYYLIQIMTEAKFAMYLLSEQKGYSYTSLYQYLTTHYSGKVLERVLLYFFAGMDGLNDLVGYSPIEFVECLQDAENYMASTKNLSLLRSRTKLSKGTAFLDFDLPDEQGNSVSLQSLKGKAVILDIWGRGCAGCAQFARMFRQQVFPGLQKKDITLVSIGTENSRDVWLTALETNKYSIPADHHLSTEGPGIKHPLFQYYQINAIPFVVLLDSNGEVYSVLSTSMGRENILRLINAAINQK